MTHTTKLYYTQLVWVTAGLVKQIADLSEQMKVECGHWYDSLMLLAGDVLSAGVALNVDAQQQTETII